MLHQKVMNDQNANMVMEVWAETMGVTVGNKLYIH